MRGALNTTQRPMGVGDVAEGLGQVAQAVMASASLAARSLQRASRDAPLLQHGDKHRRSDHFPSKECCTLMSAKRAQGAPRPVVV